MRLHFVGLLLAVTAFATEEIEVLPMMEDTTVVTKADSEGWVAVTNKTQKLDDVSSVDIAKEKRRQRMENKEKEKSEEEPPEDTKVDTITVKGAVLQGQVSELTADYLEFNLIYGKGNIQIKYDDIEQLSTEHQYHIFYKGKETTGQIVAIKEHAFLVIKHGDIEETVQISNIDRFLISTRENDSLENQFRNLSPYTRGNVDIGLEYESGTNVKHKASATIHLERKMMQYRSTFDLDYNYETTKTSGSPDQLNKNDYTLFFEQDYYLSKGDFVFGQLGFDFDEPRGIKGRAYPAIGAGHRFGESRDTWIQIKGGGGYVHERFFEYPNNSYFSGFMGVGASYKFENRSPI
ncbi:MAG TPA: DUF481 domain-containing protein, partial [Helicobacteraceae bacterium]|nr:DUF481 domain-containing protein [Helicobacteraceae bacterium]